MSSTHSTGQFHSRLIRRFESITERCLFWPVEFVERLKVKTYERDESGKIKKSHVTGKETEHILSEKKNFTSL